jgi:hypothetical protein
MRYHRVRPGPSFDGGLSASNDQIRRHQPSSRVSWWRGSPDLQPAPVCHATTGLSVFLIGPQDLQQPSIAPDHRPATRSKQGHVSGSSVQALLSAAKYKAGKGLCTSALVRTSCVGCWCWMRCCSIEPRPDRGHQAIKVIGLLHDLHTAQLTRSDMSCPRSAGGEDDLDCLAERNDCRSLLRAQLLVVA